MFGADDDRGHTPENPRRLLTSRKRKGRAKSDREERRKGSGERREKGGEEKAEEEVDRREGGVWRTFPLARGGIFSLRRPSALPWPGPRRRRSFAASLTRGVW